MVCGVCDTTTHLIETCFFSRSMALVLFTFRTQSEYSKMGWFLSPKLLPCRIFIWWQCLTFCFIWVEVLLKISIPVQSLSIRSLFFSWLIACDWWNIACNHRSLWFTLMCRMNLDTSMCAIYLRCFDHFEYSCPIDDRPLLFHLLESTFSFFCAFRLRCIIFSLFCFLSVTPIFGRNIRLR